MFFNLSIPYLKMNSATEKICATKHAVETGFIFFMVTFVESESKKSVIYCRQTCQSICHSLSVSEVEQTCMK